ncbi:MFS transporter [Streptomyces argyrophyllae]|uniref:MFS transporter n=1 Tax=Streptomyces argyrophylli TaxID=2726118 RepID=A0A6M4PG53_9ACTN|nr:MFS transporter [Streptomyces argyrophyllae]QJS09487.1 MFS transporter [Streptomyces argyrophyllae]
MTNQLMDRLPRLLHQVAFRRFWTAQTISFLGDQVSTIALPLTAVLALNASAAGMGFLGALVSLPNLLFALHVGGFVDRHGRLRRTMILCDLGRAAVLLTVPVAYALDALTLIHLWVVAFVTGTLAMLFNVSSNSLFAALVDREDYVQGTSLSRGSFSFSWVVGPSVGGVLVQIVSAPGALLADVLSFLGSASLLRSISPQEPAPEKQKSSSHIRDGLRFVSRNPVLRARFVGGGLLNLFYTVYFTLFLLFIARELKLTSGMIGVALGLGAVGALLGSFVTGWFTRRLGIGPTFLLGSVLFPGALALVPFATQDKWVAFGLVVMAEFVSGMGLMLCDIAGSSIQQALTPDRMRSRVQGAYLGLINGVRTVGALAAGGLGTWLGLRTALWLAVIGGVLSCLPLVFAPVPGMRTLPDQAE